LAAGRESSPDARAALGALCETYWPPLYAYLRRADCTPHEADDIVQGFFARLLEKGDLAQVAPERGRFRSFLLVAVKHFLANERKSARAIKRGGGRKVVSLDVDMAESRYGAGSPMSALASSSSPTPEAVFERQWAMTLIDRVRGQLRDEFTAAGKEERFERMQPFLTGEGAGSHREAATALGLSENAFKVAIHRMRQRFGALLRAEIAQTVAGENDVDDEIRHLFEALRK
jgi:RNA polymerase sigma-70 factor (ECF subfamily)